MNWKEMVGKKYFFRTKLGRFYQGIVKEVDITSPPLVFITLKDKFGVMVTLVHTELAEMKEEG